MSNVTISILVYVFNEQENLKNCLDSIIKQTLDNIEIICIDDGSVDNSLDILNEYSLKYDFIKIFSQEHQSFSIAMNKCISESSGEYIGFLKGNASYVDNNSLEQMFNLAIKKDANIINASIKSVDNSIRNNEIDCIKPEQYGMPSDFYTNIFKKSFLLNNNIRFPVLKIGYGAAFLSNALSKTDNIYTLPIYLCECKNISDSDELHSQHMQFDYLKHFCIVFNNLEDIKFKKITDEYKERFDNFIITQKNIFGAYSIQNDLIQIFGEDNNLIKKHLTGDPIKFSIVIYIHNSENYLKKCLDSCLNQSFKNIEFICVNDGSYDNSEDILKSYSFDPRIKIITNSNKQGKGGAFNMGLKLANGSYINFIDSEDYFDLDFFEYVSSYENYFNNDVIIFPISLFNNDSGESYENGFFNLACLNGFDTNILTGDYLSDCIFDIPRVPCNKLFNTNFLRELNANFLENSYFYEDAFFFKTFLNVNSVLFIDKHFYHKRVFNDMVNKIPNNILHEVIKNTNDIINVFKNENCYDLYKKELLNYKIKTIRYWYSFADEKFKKQGFYFIKNDFRSSSIQDYVNYLDNQNLLFYAMVLGLQNDVGNLKIESQKAISKLIFRLNELSNQNNDLTMKNSEYKTNQVKNKLEIINLSKDNVSLRDSNVSLKNEYTSLKEENWLKISDLMAENEKLKNDYLNLEKESADLKNSNAILNKRVADLETKIDILLSSNSWKITGPFRTVGKNLRK